MIATGIDPGSQDGAAVTLERIDADVYGLLGVVSWHRTRRRSEPYDVRVWLDGTEETLREPTLERAVRHIEALPGAGRAAVEWPVYRARKGGKRSTDSMVTLAYSAGLAAAWLVGTPELLKAPAEDWRPRVLRIRGTTRGTDAKRAALSAVQGGTVIRVPWRIEGGSVLQSDHEAEAACLAVLAMMAGG